MSDRPRIGISACLLGEPVRYNAEHKRDAWLVSVLGPQVEWVPVCPEVEAGLGTPREPMTLVRTNGIVALMTNDTNRDLTDVMRGYAERRVRELEGAALDGYVLKADSPSCGPEVLLTSGHAVPGVFAAELMARLPHLPVIDERQLADPQRRRAFLDRVFARCRSRSVDVVRVRSDARTAATDRVATEEPLEIRLHGRPFAVIMRTPGADRELAAGFLFAERVLKSADDLGAIEHCTDPDPREPPRRSPSSPNRETVSADSAVASSNIVNVTLARESADIVERLLADRRRVMGNSSCGLCGRVTIDSLKTAVDPVRAAWAVRAAVLATLPDRLRARQTVFDETGGLHAAGLFTPDGELVDIAEDVGRHNAVDKIVGRMLMRDALPLSNHLLCVSGRTSYEIVQKAVLAGIPIVCAVSAPSTLAIDLAREFGVTLVGFVRGDSFNVYGHEWRVEM
ncbi:MAG: formate dehydrogenase accessory sulfurtransferase FdhD [Acidobacteria bacterium]|nr:formate dehydrogenase accessory sulfurtransferase FdhD [Acidobacteriota bacterium]